MKRVQLFEFEDLPWFPKVLRTGMTNLLLVFQKMIGTSDLIALLLKKARSKYNFDQIIDLGSGSGGVLPSIVEALNAENTSEPIQLLLTDLHPNPAIVQQFNTSKSSAIRYSESAVDATNLSTAPKGLKTMINSFHHMPPDKAKQILRSAQEQQEPILIYEMAENNIPTLVWWLLLPISLAILILMALFMTPLVRPLNWKQLVFTYLLPLIPLFYAWDGQASLVRIYTFQDIEELLRDFRSTNYTWEIAAAKTEKGKKQGYYIYGYPSI